MQQDDRIVYLTQDGGEFEQMFNIPERNTAFCCWAKPSITDAAMRRMAASNVMVGFCGTGGSPLFSVCDIAFMTPQSEYRPTEYMQAWAEMWFDPARRMEKARCFLRRRAQMTAECWQENSYLQKLGIFVRCRTGALPFGSGTGQRCSGAFAGGARWAKRLYADLARGHGLFVREEGATFNLKSGCLQRLSGSWQLYRVWICRCSACVLGSVSPCPSCTGRREEARWYLTSRMVWDGYVMPLAFECAEGHQRFPATPYRALPRGRCFGLSFDFMKNLCVKNT
ncbi:MAG: type I-F CRISPR-associated endonuclease Cas1 [Bilophila wadsworthia]